MHNPLLESIALIVSECGSEAMTEHQLLARLVQGAVLKVDYATDSLSLFQTHFLTMNALYQLQHSFYQERRGVLLISPLAIRLEPYSDGLEMSTQLREGGDAMATYYLDWSHFSEASRESVEALLQSFWQRYLHQDDHRDALQALGLQPPVKWSEIKRRYRQLAMEHHPDRGGRPETFSQLQNAVSLLGKYYRENG